MKKVFLVLIVLLCCATSYAQHLVATLEHEGNIIVFYGMDAFKQANNSAVSGDVITLSSGLFNGNVDINKNITLRGAGWKGDKKTEIRDNIHIKIPSSDNVSNLSFEGILFSGEMYVDSLLHNPLISRCRLRELRFRNVFNGVFSSCYIEGVGQQYVPDTMHFQVTFSNCVLDMLGVHNMSFLNCIVGQNMSGSGHIFVNSILVGGYDLDYSCIAVNCVSVRENNSCFSKCNGTNNVTVPSRSSIFANYPGKSEYGYFITNTDYDDADSYELLPAAQTQYIGNDGTQVGVYGGDQPFSYIPSYPCINNMQVSNKSNDEGKINVKVEVTPAQ